MGLFTSAPVKFRRGIRDHKDSKAEFTQLANALGRPAAKQFLETLYDKWVVQNRSKIDDLKPDLAAFFMKTEREAYVARKLYVDSLGPLSASGQLATILNANTRPLAEYYNNPLGGALAARDLAIDQAANWVCGTYVPALPQTRQLLRYYIPSTSGVGGPMGGALGPTSQGVRDVFGVAVQNAAAYRLVIAQKTKYPSTVGGSLLLDYIFTATAGNTWPQFGNAHWEDIAMFYMIAMAHVQGFPDGNKRTSHLAYAIVLIKGTHAFKAPTAAKESELIRMNQ